MNYAFQWGRGRKARRTWGAEESGKESRPVPNIVFGTWKVRHKWWLTVQRYLEDPLFMNNFWHPFSPLKHKQCFVGLISNKYFAVKFIAQCLVVYKIQVMYFPRLDRKILNVLRCDYVIMNSCVHEKCIFCPMIICSFIGLESCCLLYLEITEWEWLHWSKAVKEKLEYLEKTHSDIGRTYISPPSVADPRSDHG